MLKELQNTCAGYHAKLIAVSKTKPNEKILALYDKGQRAFGENRVQELVEKYESLPKDIEWHMIGHLQKNKVKYIAPFVHLIHSVDNLLLLQTIDKEGAKNDRVISVLLQIKIATEDTKFGSEKSEIDEMIKIAHDLQHIKVCGVMGMATFTDDMGQVRSEFKSLKRSFDEIKGKHFSQDADYKEISMGMSGDHKIALEEGSTMIRVGSLLFLSLIHI